MKKLTIILLFVILNVCAFATSPLYNKDGIQLTQQITKVSTVYNTALQKNVVVWRATVVLTNTSNDAVNLNKPVFVKFNRGYVSSQDLEAIRNQGVGYNVSSNYKNNITNAALVLEPNESKSSEKYFVTFDNVDLNKEQYSWDLQYAK